MLNEQLIAELPQLLDLRVPFFDPSFEAMIRMQCKFAEEGYEKLSGVQRFDALWLAHGALITVRIGTLRTMYETTMQPASWTHKYVPLTDASTLAIYKLFHQVEGVLQEMRELTICGAS